MGGSLCTVVQIGGDKTLKRLPAIVLGQLGQVAFKIVEAQDPLW
jgi:hypothetical protein